MRAKKHLGQHFLTDRQVLQHMLQVIAPTKEQLLVEIGPGLGALTEILLPNCKGLQAIEIDKDVLASLRHRCQRLGALSILSQDVLTVDFASLWPAVPSYRLVGNLPYNISTPILFQVLMAASRIQDMHFMLQKEVTARMAANPGSKIYGRLSVMVQYLAGVTELFDVPPQAFNPPPKVDSAVVRLIPYQQKPIQAKDETHFANLVMQVFGQRRKMLRASLKQFYPTTDVSACPIDITLRPEQLSVADFVTLSDFLIHLR